MSSVRNIGSLTAADVQRMSNKEIREIFENLQT